MNIAIIALKYLEPEWQQTVDCLKATGLPVFYADRDGVGNMSRAFNEAFVKHVQYKYQYVWFVTNITFDKDVPFKLVQELESTMISAIHPAMPTSDHLHLRSDGSNGARVVPFIEFTAPLFNAAVFNEYMIDENLWFYYMDLELCHRMQEDGLQVAVHNGCSIGHTYLRNAKTTHPISAIRKLLREQMTKPNQQYLADMYGPDWRQLFNWKG